jgi:hypothetical protein
MIKYISRRFSKEIKGYYDYMSETINNENKNKIKSQIVDNTDVLLKIIKCPMSEMDFQIDKEHSHLIASVRI